MRATKWLSLRQDMSKPDAVQRRRQPARVGPQSSCYCAESLEPRVLLSTNFTGASFPPLAGPQYAVGIAPRCVISADVDGDGKMDIITANNGSNDISVLRNLGNGSFAQQVRYAVGMDPDSILATDINGDRKLDLVTANNGVYPNYDGTISILRNIGGDSFAPQVSYRVGRAPQSLAAADVNGDGKVDLVTAHSGFYPHRHGSVTVLQNLGRGQFGRLTAYRMGKGTVAVTPMDVNGDKKIDLVAANSDSKTISVLFNAGNGALGPKINYAVSQSPYSVTAADVDGDGKMDVIFTSSDFDLAYGVYGEVYVLRNLGFGVLAPALSVASMGRLIEVADVDADGRVDLVTTNNSNRSAATISVRKNLGNFTFAPPIMYAIEATTSAIAVADIDLDGAVDLVVADGSANAVSIMRNSGDGHFATQTVSTLEGFNSLKAMASGDMDGDGRTDLIAVGYPGQIAVLYNLGDGAFVRRDVAEFSAAIRNDVLAADVDSDGKLDLVVANAAGTVSVLKNLGDGTFDAEVTYAEPGYRPEFVTAADVDGDGHVDLVTAKSERWGVRVLRNLGDGTFTFRGLYGGNVPCVALADINGDGMIDLITAESTGYPNYDDWVLVWLNRGDGVFASYAEDRYALGRRPDSIVAADLDDDGNVDIAVGCAGSDSISLLRGLGDGTFADQIRYDVDGVPASLRNVDTDGDGRAELAMIVYNSHGSRIALLRNLGVGEPAVQASYAVMGSPEALVSADIDGDGRTDLALVQNYPNAISVLSNSELDDTTRPTVIINQTGDQVDPASAAINFTVTFSEVVNDFGAEDMKLSGTAGAIAAIVTGSGTTYNVAVSGMKRSGTVIAAIVAGKVHDAAGNPNIASTSTDDTVAYELGKRPKNDNFAHAATITAEFVVSGYNDAASREAGEPIIAGRKGGASLWWTWTAPKSGRVTIETGYSVMVTLLGVYTGSSVLSLKAIASDDSSGGNGKSMVSFNAVKGRTYHIAVDGLCGAWGDIWLSLQMA